MHHKFAIIDDSIVLGGSYNWSIGADYNFEHLYVIKDYPIAVQKFIIEFDYLKASDTQSIYDLQNLDPCSHPGCMGSRFNLLVFDPLSNDDFFTYGDLINICTIEPYEHFEVIENALSDRFLQNLADARLYQYERLFDLIDNNDDTMPGQEVEERKKDIEALLALEPMIYGGKYVNSKQRVVHAIGKLQQEKMTNKNIDPDWFTHVLWKQKFCSTEIEDSYYTTFDMR